MIHDLIMTPARQRLIARRARNNFKFPLQPVQPKDDAQGVEHHKNRCKGRKVSELGEWSVPVREIDA